jgi:hypothetical protein
MTSSSFARNTKGAAGVHLVVAQLSLLGYVALPTTRNLKSIDIVAFNEHLSKFAFIQVKSTDKPKGGWPIHTIRKEEGWEEEVLQREKVFYVLVSLPNPLQDQPAYYVVPSADLAKIIIDDMKHYLAGKPALKAKGQVLGWGYGGLSQEFITKYQNNWGILNLGE